MQTCIFLTAGENARKNVDGYTPFWRHQSALLISAASKGKPKNVLSTQNLHKPESENEIEDEVKKPQSNVISDYESDTSSENEEGDDHVVQQPGPRNNDRYGITYVLVHNHQAGIKKR